MSGPVEWPPNSFQWRNILYSSLGSTYLGQENIGQPVALGVMWPPTLEYKPLIHRKVSGGSPHVGIHPLEWDPHPLQGRRDVKNTTTVGGNFEFLSRPPACAVAPPLPMSVHILLICSTSSPTKLPVPPLPLCVHPGIDFQPPTLSPSLGRPPHYEVLNVILICTKDPQDPMYLEYQGFLNFGCAAWIWLIKGRINIP